MIIIDCCNCNSSWGLTKNDLNNDNGFQIKCPNCGRVNWLTQEQFNLLYKKEY